MTRVRDSRCPAADRLACIWLPVVDGDRNQARAVAQQTARRQRPRRPERRGRLRNGSLDRLICALKRPLLSNSRGCRYRRRPARAPASGTLPGTSRTASLSRLPNPARIQTPAPGRPDYPPHTTKVWCRWPAMFPTAMSLELNGSNHFQHVFLLHQNGQNARRSAGPTAMMPLGSTRSRQASGASVTSPGWIPAARNGAS